MLTLAGLALRFDGLLNLDLVVVSLGLSVIVLALCCTIMVTVRALLVYGRLRQQGTRELVLTAETGHRRVSEFCLPATWWLPFINLSWRWVTPSASVDPLYMEGHLKESVQFQQRGVHSRLMREFLIEDLFGLAKIRFQWKSPALITVFPHCGKLLEPPLLIRLSSGDEISDPRGEMVGDRVDMRQYVRGDSPRTILWKVFARTRRLMVRVPERSLAARPRVCSYLICGEGDEPAAALARVVLEKNLLGQGWRFGCDGQSGYETRLEAALKRIASSGNRDATEPDSTQLGIFLEQAGQDGFAQCLLLLPPKLEDPKQSEQIARAVAHAGLAVTVCLAVDGIDPPRTNSRLHSFVFFQNDKSRCSSDDLREAAQMWGRHPGEVMLVDRQAGVLLGDLRNYQRTLERNQGRQSA